MTTRKKTTVKEVQVEEIKTHIVPLNEQLNEQVEEVKQEDMDKENRVNELESAIIMAKEQIKQWNTELKALNKVKNPDGPTKMERAKEVYERMKGEERKEILKAFVDEVGLTKAGSTTYYALIKNKK